MYKKRKGAILIITLTFVFCISLLLITTLSVINRYWIETSNYIDDLQEHVSSNDAAYNG